MRQFVFVVPRGSPASVSATRLREAESLRAKFSDCERDIALAREYSEVVVRDPVIRISSDLPQRLQQLLEKTPDGRMTPPEPTAAGIEVVAVCGRKETIADLSSRTEIRNQLLTQRLETQEKQVLDRLRKQTIIEYR
jgi:peptidyl-prolyl cis-trans isomerase SurA